MKFKDYQEELENVIRTTRAEYDLYWLISTMIREKTNMNNNCIRDISRSRRQEANRLLHGAGAFPDFVVLTKDYEYTTPRKKDILGVVEVKYTFNKPDKIKIFDAKASKKSKYKKRMEYYVTWFNKVLYTNGLHWQYFEYIPSEEDITKIKILQAANFENNRDYTSNEEFCSLLKKVSTSNTITSWEITLGKATNDGYNAYIEWADDAKWETLIQHLKAIQWDMQWNQ